MSTSTPATGSLRLEGVALLRLAGPVALLQLGLMAMGVVDTMMIGRVSATALAGVALGHLYSFTCLGFGMGVLMALDPLVSQAIGGRDSRAEHLAVQRGLVLATLVAIPVGLLALPCRAILEWFGQDPAVVPPAIDYVHISVAGILPFLLFVLGRQCLQAMQRTRPLVLAILSANVVNALVNYALIFGNWGFPALGVEGSAWATVISRWFMLAALFVMGGWMLLKPHLSGFGRHAFEWKPLRAQFLLGVPIGLQMSVEMTAFSAVGLMAGQFGEAVLGGHQIALNLAAVAFMLPVGIANAASVRVGNAIGRGDPTGARRAAAFALGLTVVVMATTGLTFLLLPQFLAGAYTQEAAVLAVAVALIPLAGVFQIADGLQVVCGGILRGAGDTRTAMLVHAGSFWAVGIPVGYWLAHSGGVGPKGLWWGLVLGLGLCAVVLFVAVLRRLRGALTRLEWATER